jgi:hypothetical protein
MMVVANFQKMKGYADSMAFLPPADEEMKRFLATCLLVSGHTSIP